MLRLGAAAVAAVVLVAAPASAGTAKGRPYRLFTHCGVQHLVFQGHAYRATTVPPGPRFSAPSHWGNPYQLGRLRRTTHGRLIFSSLGHHDLWYVPVASAPTGACI